MDCFKTVNKNTGIGKSSIKFKATSLKSFHKNIFHKFPAMAAVSNGNISPADTNVAKGFISFKKKNGKDIRKR
jgi:hypothetical protein